MFLQNLFIKTTFNLIISFYHFIISIWWDLVFQMGLTGVCRSLSGLWQFGVFPEFRRRGRVINLADRCLLLRYKQPNNSVFRTACCAAEQLFKPGNITLHQFTQCTHQRTRLCILILLLQHTGPGSDSDPGPEEPQQNLRHDGLPG